MVELTAPGANLVEMNHGVRILLIRFDQACYEGGEKIESESQMTHVPRAQNPNVIEPVLVINHLAG
jgi:hypothetical protein